ncbi:para, partial [Symbiodinium sp. KB8]
DSMLTLFMSITGGVSWVEVLRPLQAISIFWSYCFLFFVSFTYFAVLNVLTAVFCQTAIESAQNDQATMVQTMLDSKEAILDKLKALFYEIDVEEDAGKKHAGSLTVTMFEEKMRNPDVHNFFESLGLDVWDAWSFFKLLDADGGGAVDTNEFFQGCLRFRGPARSMDVGKLIQDQKWMIHNQGKFQEYVQDELAQVKEKLSLLCDSFSAEGDEDPFSKES